MKRLTLAEFRECSDEFDACVRTTPGVSHFCSGSFWQISAHDFLHGIPEGKAHFIVEHNRGQSDSAWLVFVEREQPRVFFPFESAWMFGSPLIGDPEVAVELLREAARVAPSGPNGFCIGGLEENGAMYRALQDLRSGAMQYSEFPATDSMVVDLSDGIDGWLSRRSKKFRRSLGMGDKDGEILLIDAADTPPGMLFSRILEVQKKTYKWRAGSDIFQIPEYSSFYRALLGKLHASGELRLLFAQRNGEDVAHIFGGVSGTTYRGLQMSYIEEVRTLGIGNRLQMENLRRCAEEGIIRYDLGMHSPYKERWTDRREVNLGVFVVM